MYVCMYAHGTNPRKAEARLLNITNKFKIYP